ncbi:flagellar biosynthesis protein FlhF [Paenibacillus sp. LHD-117]|uniref:flagellar biosynthesis protein FlhF n=1 Tax=Paenibacillus sp. LHD-117 TaxID=3071412 RepID=UPI0027E00EB3|nr:flagellar biosynthesis protein FlhF [Paenibacillus sp. LHD-117]MDQ6419240.1 flagellar biosynthesis protein FlhF [Paenibacillus sp. LHD-117]
MRVKRYIVSALPEAVSMIRTDLGSDAVILDTKEVKVGGFMGMFRKKKMEVIAAVESGGAKPSEPSQRRSQPEVSAMVEQILQTAQRSGSATATATMEPPPAILPTNRGMQMAYQASAATQAQPVEPAQLRPTAPAADENRRLEKEQFIINEIRDLREYMVKLTKGQQELQTLSEPLLALKERMSLQEIDPAWIDRLLDTMKELEQAEGISLDHAETWRRAASQLEEWMLPYCFSGIRADAKVLHFVGPTGVGKTTTIAKLAAEYTIKQGRRVGFITSDTYRIAAVDQLRTYANILNVPLEVVFSPMDLPKAHHALGERDIILMDTAGRNFRSELHVSEVNSLLQANEPNETILVVSLTGKTADMVAIAERFKKFGVSKVLFTKLDETSVYGAIFNLVMNVELLPTYLASGQNVPDDIAIFDCKTYVRILLGEPAHE